MISTVISTGQLIPGILVRAANESWADRWIAFVVVLAASLISACAIVALYALGLRLISIAGRVPLVEPLEFTGQITVIDPEDLRRRRKHAKKAAKRSALTRAQKRWAAAAAYACFIASGGMVLLGIYLIVPALHGG